jgi:Fe-S-cluster containining protein
MLEGACGTAVRPVDGIPRFFRADTKCCTYHPRLPNYLVGAILADEDPAAAEGRKRIAARVASRVGVTPEWLHAPRAFTLLYDRSRHAFGRAAGLRCPYYEPEAGACTIWRHRDAVCSTYFCKYVAGEDGRRFWTRVKELVSLVEIQLARLALLELMPEALEQKPPAPEPLSPEDIDGAPPPAAEHAARWGAWMGREEAFYRECHEVARGVDAAKLTALLGLDGVIARRAVERALERMTSPALPAYLRLDPAATVQWLPDGSVALGAYSGLEAVALPGAAYRLLVRFTGEEPVAAVRARLRAEERADLADEVLMELYRHRVLVDAREGAPAR